MAYDLSPEEVRVLGALIEKEHTTPDYYPLTLNGLINACNQKSNREPVVSFGDRTVLEAIDRLRDRQFAWTVQSVDSRVPKFEENFTAKLQLTLQEAAVLCVLMLRGPQTPGEMRQRGARINPFESLDEVQVTLDTLCESEPPLVCRLPLQPGRKEARYSHLLMGEPLPEEEPPFVRAEPRQDETQRELERLNSETIRLHSETARLAEELAELRRMFQEFKAQFE